MTDALDCVMRVAGPADLDAIMALETATFENDAWSPAMMRSDLELRHTYYLVAERAEHPSAALLGYAGLLSPRGAADADIQTIAVAPDARGQGLGRKLMQALIAEAARRGARRVFLEVRADNPGAQHLYRTLGFTDIGVRRGYYQPDNVDAVVMRLDLAGSNAAGSNAAGSNAAGSNTLGLTRHPNQPEAGA
ncbi:ribosomal protein S18-alanine N-acetyltransferase [Subtercola endophyticus]|uniref:ribosomal protein S18-alanine N-acetyltransferase n=1 Tax=Subtercola endophyticus TaxID=2895559 RepID=UPI001E61F11A|nr:ribosomal protein S18-alanine N-acetyltransferase [Subtercola endophyticus]UFS59366.1 ribosomal protein S18-alanine N-acetyltransferase [Subtercola endophyticus]